jgi:hypothetical protein
LLAALPVRFDVTCAVRRGFFASAPSSVSTSTASSVALRGSLTDSLQMPLAAATLDRPAAVAQRANTAPTRTQAKRQARRSRAATAAQPVTPETRRAVSGCSPFTNPNATRTARAALHFDTGHSL